MIQPTISADLGLSASEAQWVVNSFFLAMALFAAPGGRLGDYYGHRQVLLVALAVFALGSLAAAVSQGFIWLIVGIGIAGAGASTLYPLKRGDDRQPGRRGAPRRRARPVLGDRHRRCSGSGR